ncbi:MAG: right-handed parallel beta-helix repeat-containing protein, partial [Deltaproteobacteria bacterium]|nr:right-handed parallel beta-helix repeat-containing protein [Deltaproteobacteria bacterium]
MQGKSFIAISGLLVSVALLWSLPSAGDAGEPKTREVTCSSKKTIGEELRKLDPGDTLLVSGVCSENVVIPEEIHRITLDGQGTATINGPDATRAAINVRGRVITIRGFTITGGENGVMVDDGGAALIDGNSIQSTGSNGVLVNRHSSARIIDNTIQNNPGAGILVTEGSSARIGFLSGSDTVASPNIIQSNGGSGVNVTRSSQTRIVGNTISNNTDNGVLVNRGSHADIASNAINGNAGDGVLVIRNSGVNLGEDAGTGIFDSPNITTVNNGGFGIRCRINSYADGRRGSLNGNAGATSFDTTVGTP